MYKGVYTILYSVYTGVYRFITTSEAFVVKGIRRVLLGGLRSSTS